jgi:hypothetical protein
MAIKYFLQQQTLEKQEEKLPVIPEFYITCLSLTAQFHPTCCLPSVLTPEPDHYNKLASNGRRTG